MQYCVEFYENRWCVMDDDGEIYAVKETKEEAETAMCDLIEQGELRLTQWEDDFRYREAYDGRRDD